MGKIKRRVKQRKVVKRKNNKPLTEEELNSIPPHVLDKIPSSMSLKPTAQSLRSIMMQRYAQSLIQMPLNNQQQQAQTMKTNNDIKEQSINQSKQEIIVQRERQANLRREEANIKSEEQRMKQQAQYDKEVHQLQRTKEKVDFDKKMLDEEGDLMKARREKESLEALVQQSKFEVQRLKTLMEKDEYTNKIQSLTREKELLNAENQGLLEAVNKMVKEDQLKQIKELTDEITRQQAQNIINKRLVDAQNELIQNELDNKLRISTDLLNDEIKKRNDDITKYQADLAKQMSDNETHQRILKKYDFINENISKAEIESERLKMENTGYQETIKSFDSPKKRQDLEKLIQNKAKQEVDNAYLEKKIEINNDIQNNQNEINYKNAKLQTYNSPEYKQQIEDINVRQKLNDYLGEMKANSDKMAELHKEKVHSQARANVAQLISDTLSEGGNVFNALEEAISKVKDEKDPLSEKQNEELYKQQIAQYQTSNMEFNEHANLAKEIIEIFNSDGISKAAYNEFVDKEAKNMSVENIVKFDNKTLKEFSDRLNKFIETRTQQADAQVANDQDQIDFLA